MLMPSVRYENVPVQPLDAERQASREKFMAAGMDDYVTKPINLRVIQNMLRKVYLKEYTHE